MIRPAALHKSLSRLSILISDAGKNRVLHEVASSLMLIENSICDNARYIPEFFKPEEYLPPEAMGSGVDISLFMDSRILWTLDAIRDHFKKPITVNNWKIGGPFKYRGWRPAGISTGSRYSQHYFGRAVDFDVKEINVETVRQEIILLSRQQSPTTRFITALEDIVSWVHIDCRNSGSDFSIKIIKP